MFFNERPTIFISFEFFSRHLLLDRVFFCIFDSTCAGVAMIFQSNVSVKKKIDAP